MLAPFLKQMAKSLLGMECLLSVPGFISWLANVMETQRPVTLRHQQEVVLLTCYRFETKGKFGERNYH